VSENFSTLTLADAKTDLFGQRASCESSGIVHTVAISSLAIRFQNTQMRLQKNERDFKTQQCDFRARNVTQVCLCVGKRCKTISPKPKSNQCKWALRENGEKK
jgi:hypothetical protein